MNKDSPVGRLFPPLSRYGERIIDSRTQSKITNQDLSSDPDFLKQYRFKESGHLLSIINKNSHPCFKNIFFFV